MIWNGFQSYRNISNNIAEISDDAIKTGTKAVAAPPNTEYFLFIPKITMAIENINGGIQRIMNMKSSKSSL